MVRLLHPAFAVLVPAAVVVAFQLTCDWLLIGAGMAHALGVRAVLHDASPIPTLGDARVALAATAVADTAATAFALRASTLPRLAIGLIVGGTLANAVQLVLGGVLDWIPLGHIALLSPGDVAVGTGVGLIVAIYFWASETFSARLSRVELAFLAGVWAAFGVLAGLRHNTVVALTGLSVFPLALVAHAAARIRARRANSSSAGGARAG